MPTGNLGSWIFTEVCCTSFENMEEEYVGEGQAEDSIASETSVAKVCSTLNNAITEADIIDTLFENCDVDKKGHIQVSNVINYLKNTSVGADQENEDFEELWLMFDKGFDDVTIDLETFRQVMQEYIARSRSKKDEMSSYSEMINANEVQLLIGSPNSPNNAKHIGGFFGISDIRLVNCTLGSLSLEGKGGDVSEIPDSLQLIMENEDLKLQAKKMQEDFCKQDAFVAQLEEQAAQQQLQVEIQEKQLSSLLEKNYVLQQECEDWQRQLQNYQDENHFHKDTINRLKQDCNFLDAKTKQLEAEFAEISVDLENLEQSKKELLHLMSLQKALFEESELKNRLQEKKIILQASNAGALQDYIHELQEEITGLRCDNKDLKNSLVETQDELLGLQKRMSAMMGRLQKMKIPEGNNQNSWKRAFDEEVLSSLRNPPMQKSLSLDEEMRQVDDSALNEDALERVANEEFLSLWKILVDVTEAEHQANQLANSLQCNWNHLTSKQHPNRRRVGCQTTDNNCLLSNNIENGSCEKQMDIDGKEMDSTDMKPSLQSQEVPVDLSVELVKEGICKEVKTLRIHLARSQAVLAVLMRSMEEAKLQSSAQTTFVAYNCQRPSDLPHSNPLIGSRCASYNRPLTGRKHLTARNISLDTGGVNSTPSHKYCNRRTLSCPNLSHLSTHMAAVEAVANPGKFEEISPVKTTCEEACQEEDQLSSSPESLRNRSHSFLAAIKRGKIGKPLDELPHIGESPSSANQNTAAASGGYMSSNTLPTVYKQVPQHTCIQTDVFGDVEEDSSSRAWATCNSSNRRRQRGPPGTGSPNCIQRCAAVDFDEIETESAVDAPLVAHPTAVSLERMSSQTSETESAKGFRSMDQDPAIEVISPNLNDGLLRNLQVHKESEKRIETLSEPELEAKFQSLCLAAKTDKLTVSKRIDLHLRQRDIAEKNVESELKSLKTSIEELKQLSLGANAQQALEDLQNHMAVLQLSTSRLSSRAEIFGAVQQEARMCKAVEVMIMYVEGVRRLYDSVQRELEKSRRLLSNCALIEDTSDGIADEFRYGKIIRTNTLLASGNQRKSEGRSRSLQIPPSFMGRRRFSMDAMPIAQLRLSQCDMDLRSLSVRDNCSSNSSDSTRESKQYFPIADEDNAALENSQSANCQGYLQEASADVSKNSSDKSKLFCVRYPRSFNTSSFWSPVIALGQTRIIIGGLLLLVAILSMMLKTFANRLLLVPDAASTSLWDIFVGEMFKPITRNQHSTQTL